MDHEKAQREYERCLTKHQQISSGFTDDKEDCNDQSKPKLLPVVSTHRASRSDDDGQQPNTYVAGERYNNPLMYCLKHFHLYNH